MKPSSDISDARVIKALTHPLRISILAALEQRTASPSELADELGAPLGNVSYHVRQLAALGLIKLVKKTPRRGAIEHYYEAVGRAEISDAAWAETPEIVKEALVSGALTEIATSVRAASAAGGFSHSDVHLSRERLTVDADGWKQISVELKRMHDRIVEIAAASKKRLDKGAHDGEREASVVMMLFEAAPVEERDGSKRTKGARAKAASP